MRWVSYISFLIVGLGCLVIGVSCLYLGIKYAAKRLSRVFISFGILFLVGGLLPIELSTKDVGIAAAVTVSLLTVPVSYCAVMTILCAKNVYYWLKQFAVWERFLKERVRDVGQRADPKEREAAVTLAEIRNMIHSVREEMRVEGVQG